MSRIVFQSKGLDSLIHDVDGYIKELNKEITIAGAENLKAVQKHARKNHRFGSKAKNTYSKGYLKRQTNTGKLEQAIHVEQDQKGNKHEAMIFLNDTHITTSSGKSYGTFVHEGTYQGYKQSPISPPYSSSTSKSGKGWKADPFLWRAIDQKWKMTKSLKKITAKLKKKYERV